MSKQRLAKQVGKRLQQLRRERGLTLERLAWEAGEEDEPGLTKGYLSKIETGQQLPSLEVLCKLARRLDVAPYQLLVLDDDPASSAINLIRKLPAPRIADLVAALQREATDE